MIRTFFKKVNQDWTRKAHCRPGLTPLVFMVILCGMLFAQVPGDWYVNENEYEYFMTITCIAVVNGVESANSGNVIAAFVNEECRGVEYTTETSEEQLFFLMVYSNTNGETVTFKLYSEDIDSVLDVSNLVVFSAGDGIGTVDEPYEFIANYYINSVTSVVPERFNLLTSYPNPFNNLTNIQFELTEDTFVQLSVFNVNGERVAILVNERKPAGDYIVSWNSKNASGADCPSGEYIIQLVTNNEQYRCKVTLIK